MIEAYKLYEWDAMCNNSISTVENEGVESQNPRADLAITALNNATGSYDFVISNLVAPRGFKEVLVPTWSEKNGQDDIIWYKAAKQANGDYKVTVRSSNHKGDSGLYNSHVYLVDNDGKFIGLGGKQVTLDITKTQGTLTIANNDKNRGTFDVLITNLTNSSGISGVVIPVWSEQNGQDDLVWHNATKQEDGSYKVTISASQHKWNSGKYIVHGYIVDSSGKNIGFGATSADVVAPKKIGSASRGNYDVLKPKASFSIENNNKVTGTFDAVVRDIVAPLGVKEVLIPSWSLANGQDDLIWHKAAKQHRESKLIITNLMQNTHHALMRPTMLIRLV